MPEPSKSALTLSNHLVISIMLENALTCLSVSSPDHGKVSYHMICARNNGDFLISSLICSDGASTVCEAWA